MNYEVFLDPDAKKNIDRFPVREARRIYEKMALLAENPRPQKTRKLKGENAYRIRVGEYRVIYDSTHTVTVYKVARKTDTTYR